VALGGGRRGRSFLHNIFWEIINLENLFLAWKEFRKGKKERKDVQKFEFRLEDNLFLIHEELKKKNYKHLPYTSFFIQDPKLRRINKATVRDRVVHQATFRILYQIFDKTFFFDSYSCRLCKGNHGAVRRLETFVRRSSRNYSRNIYVLKCDIKKFFDSIDHQILLSLVKRKILDDNTNWLLEKIIYSFEKTKGKGLPLGNVTSQIFANIYLNELDYFVKHELKVKYYIRYCDDFVILAEQREILCLVTLQINDFLKNVLKLELHENKIIIRKPRQGVDFLGYVVLPHYKVLRTKTKRRILKKLQKKRHELERGDISSISFHQSLQSYLGILTHCKGFKVKKDLLSI